MGQRRRKARPSNTTPPSASGDAQHPTTTTSETRTGTYARSASLAATLLEPQPLGKDTSKEFLFTRHSRKLKGRVYARTPAGYELFVRLESDPTVVRYNLLVPPVAVMTLDGDARDASPAAVGVDATGQLTVHSFAEVAPATDDSGAKAMRSKGGLDWAGWATKRGWKHVLWTAEALTANPIRQENLKRLLLHVCVEGAAPKPALQERLMEELKQVRTLTVHALRGKLPLEDSDAVMAAIAALILDGKVFSDIDESPFDSITRLSAHPHGLRDE
jgi:hypothetical protein